jgi:hypothetical protein
LLLKRQFGLETVWDHPENNIVGPKEVDIEIDKILLEQDKPATTTKAKVYRPVSKLSQDVIPLDHCSNWNNRIGDIADIYYLIVAIKYGRGFLVHVGISLDDKREYKTWIDIIGRVCLTGYKTLAGY